MMFDLLIKPDCIYYMLLYGLSVEYQIDCSTNNRVCPWYCVSIWNLFGIFSKIDPYLVLKLDVYFSVLNLIVLTYTYNMCFIYLFFFQLTRNKGFKGFKKDYKYLSMRLALIIKYIIDACAKSIFVFSFFFSLFWFLFILVELWSLLSVV